MSGENRGGLTDLDPKLRSGFFNLPDSSRHFRISRDGHPDLLKKFEVSQEQSGLSPIFPDFPRFFPNFSDLKRPEKIEENSG